MPKKFKTLMDRHAVTAAIIAFAVIEVLLLGLGRLLSLLPDTLAMDYLREIVLIIVPIAIVCFFGFAPAFKKGNFMRGMRCFLPYTLFLLFALGAFFANNLGEPEVTWSPWYMILYGVFSIIGVGIREECVYRATIQHIVARKHANSPKGIWLTVWVGSIIFGLSHAANLLFGVEPMPVLRQVISATFIGLLFGAVYLRSGNLWAAALIHTLTDIVGLSKSTFLGIGMTNELNEMTLSLGTVLSWVVYLGFTAYLLRPAKCKEIYENLGFAENAPEADAHQ